MTDRGAAPAPEPGPEPEPGTPDVRLERVTKRFGDVVAVDDLSLSFVRGEFFSLLGPSGCGKTTTLRMIGGFEDPTAGTIHLGGTDVTDLPPYRRDVNTVFQSYALFPHLNVFENVAFGLKRHHVADRDVRGRVGEMLDLVELPGYERRKPRELSGGQQQRVALARALVNHPRVLLLDEPLGALDLKLRRQMQLELKRIQTEVGITFIYVTHDQEEAMTMSDTIAVMRAGHVEQLDRPQALYERPATEFVAGFLGISNLLDGTVVSQAGALAEIQLADGTCVRAPASAVNGGGAVRIGVRPEKLSLLADADIAASPSPASPATNVLRGVLRDTSYLGVSTQYTVATRDGVVLTIYSQNRDAPAGTPPRDGDPVQVAWAATHTFTVPVVSSVAERGGPDV